MQYIFHVITDSFSFIDELPISTHSIQHKVHSPVTVNAVVLFKLKQMCVSALLTSWPGLCGLTFAVGQCGCPVCESSLFV